MKYCVDSVLKEQISIVPEKSYINFKSLQLSETIELVISFDEIIFFSFNTAKGLDQMKFEP